jgi:hypothetical protein
MEVSIKLIPIRINKILLFETGSVGVDQFFHHRFSRCLADNPISHHLPQMAENNTPHTQDASEVQ